MWRLFGEGPMEKTKKNFGKTKKIIGKKQKKQRHIKWYTNGFWNGILKVYDMVH